MAQIAPLPQIQLSSIYPNMIRVNNVDNQVTHRGLVGKVEELSVGGTADLAVCNLSSRSFDLCADMLNVTVSMKSGPNMPFRLPFFRCWLFP